MRHAPTILGLVGTPAYKHWTLLDTLKNVVVLILKWRTLSRKLVTWPWRRTILLSTKPKRSTNTSMSHCPRMKSFEKQWLHASLDSLQQRPTWPPSFAPLFPLHSINNKTNHLVSNPLELPQAVLTHVKDLFLRNQFPWERLLWFHSVHLSCDRPHSFFSLPHSFSVYFDSLVNTRYHCLASHYKTNCISSLYNNLLQHKLRLY